MDEFARLGLITDDDSEPGNDAAVPTLTRAVTGTGQTSLPVDQSQANTAGPSVEELALQIEDQKRRNAGLQRRLQQELASKQQIEQRMAQLEEYALTAQLANLPPEERSNRLAQFRNEREVRSKQARIAEDEAALEARARDLVVIELSRRYGTPPSEFAHLSTPQDMEWAARRYAELTRAQQGAFQPQVPQAQAPAPVTSLPARDPMTGRFESGNPSFARPKPPTSLEESYELFRSLGKRAGIR